MSNGESNHTALTRLIAPQNFTEALEIAGKLAGSQLVPKAYQGKPADIVIAWEMGAEVGLSPLAALQSIAVISGKPTLYGEAPLAVVMASGLLEEIVEENDGEIATCTVKRKGRDKPVTRTFSMEQARKAKVFERDAQGVGKWIPLAERWSYQYWGQDMIGYRARGRALKALFPDVLKGLGIREAEIEDPDDDARTVVGSGSTGPDGVVVEDDVMPKQKVAEPPAAAPTVEAPAGVQDTAGDGATAGAPAGSTPVNGRRKRAPKVVAEVKFGIVAVGETGAVRVPPGAQTEIEAAPGSAPNPASAQPEAAGGAVGVEPAPDDMDAPGAPDGPQEFMVGQTLYQTKGLTREQILATFTLVPQVDRQFGKGTAKTIFTHAFPGLTDRRDLTRPQGDTFLALLTKKMAEAPA